MSSRSPQTPNGPAAGRPYALLPATLVCGVLWLGIVLAATAGAGTSVIVAVASGGVLITAAVLIAIQRQHNRLVNLAATDALTGLPNHRAFHEALAGELDRARATGRPVSLVAIDLDGFKEINDTHGHPYGDEILREVGAALRSAIRPADVAARTGGDEFGLILVGVDETNAFAIAERARKAVGSIPAGGFELSCSAGIAVHPSDADDPSALFQLADSALYWAKRGGKRRTRRFDADNTPAAWSRRQGDEVRELLALEHPVEPVFQPVVSLGTGRIVGYEALARFGVSGRRSPDVWFAQAHALGLGDELEAAAIRAALETPGRPLETHLAVNVSPSALDSDIVREALAGDLSGIVVEITEHEFVADDDALADAITDLRSRGALIAMDDAGTGHSGLNQLMRVRPDIVKFDRALTRLIHTDPARMALVESFVRFARDVDATVCSEGIESLDELATVADLDVQWGQGYVLARPGPPWEPVNPIAADVCRASLAETFRSLPAAGHRVAGDRRLVHLSARLAGAKTRTDLESALSLMSEELRASKVCLSAWHPETGLIETLAENGEQTGETSYHVSGYPLSGRVLHEQVVVQVLVGDPDSDPHEVELLLQLGERSLLMVPVVAAGRTLGMIETYRAVEKPWSRTEINRARLVANQFASVIGAFVDSERLQS